MDYTHLDHVLSQQEFYPTVFFSVCLKNKPQLNLDQAEFNIPAIVCVLSR